MIYIDREMLHVFIARLRSAAHGYLGHICDPVEKRHGEVYLMHISFHQKSRDGNWQWVAEDSFLSKMTQQCECDWLVLTPPFFL